jgi:non-ribosomal peptide synthetase component F
MSGICGQTMLAEPGLSLAWLDHPQPARGTIGNLVRAAAAASPDAVALTGVTGSLTYSGLMQRAGQVHAALVARGAKRGDFIAVLAGRELDLPALLLGILDSGCGYVPLAPHYPVAFIDSVLTAAQPALILASRHMSAQLGATWHDRLICIEEITRPHRRRRLAPHPTRPMSSLPPALPVGPRVSSFVTAMSPA